MKNTINLCAGCQKVGANIKFFAIEITGTVSKWAVVGLCKDKAIIENGTLIVETDTKQKKTVKKGDWVYIIIQHNDTFIFVVPDKFISIEWSTVYPTSKK